MFTCLFLLYWLLIASLIVSIGTVGELYVYGLGLLDNSSTLQGQLVNCKCKGYVY